MNEDKKLIELIYSDMEVDVENSSRHPVYSEYQATECTKKCLEYIYKELETIYCNSIIDEKLILQRMFFYGELIKEINK
jgi:hypothetical protein